MTERTFEERIEAFPALRAHMEKLLRLAEDGLSEIKTGDDAETCVIESGQALQQAVLQGWAEMRVEEESAAVRSGAGGARNKGKKNCGGGRR